MYLEYRPDRVCFECFQTLEQGINCFVTMLYSLLTCSVVSTHLFYLRAEIVLEVAEIPVSNRTFLCFGIIHLRQFVLFLKPYAKKRS